MNFVQKDMSSSQDAEMLEVTDNQNKKIEVTKVTEEASSATMVLIKSIPLSLKTLHLSSSSPIYLVPGNTWHGWEIRMLLISAR